MVELVVTSADEAVDELLAFAADNKPRFPTGVAGLDSTCGMIGPTELGLVWARPSSGKSTLLLNIINATPDVPTVFINLEMTPRRQIEWLTCMATQLPVPAKDVEDVLRRERFPEHYTTVVNALRRTGTRHRNTKFISSFEAPAVDDIARAVNTLREREGVVFQRVFIDHLGLMADARDYDGIQRTARELHHWAVNDEVAVIAVQQTGRGGSETGRNDGHIPVTLSSGIFGGEDAADWIWGMFRPERDPKFQKLHNGSLSDEKWEEMNLEFEQVQGVARLQLLKNRPYGETELYGKKLIYDKHTRRLEEGM